jgi:hypothetical protein
VRPLFAAAAAAGALLRALASSLAQAGPPEPPQPSAPVAELAGVWLSLELIGPRGAQIDAAEAMREAGDPPIIDALPRGGAPPPGELVGRVETLEQALRWVQQYAFEGGAVGFDTHGDSPAPLPGGALLREHGVHVTALVLTGASQSGGTVAHAWPPASALPTPATWLPASLASARAPVFAAPSAALPPASERYQVVARADAIWQLGALDRCSQAGECLRWAQILARQGDRWFGGWVLAAQVVADREWTEGPDGRRFALIASHRDRAQVGYVLLEQLGDRHEAPRGVTQAHAGSSWPSAAVQILGQQLLAIVGGEPALTLELLPSPALLQPK